MLGTNIQTRKEKNGENESTFEREVGVRDWDVRADSDSSLRIEKYESKKLKKSEYSTNLLTE